MKIALVGDSTTETYYLRASNNPALQSNFGKPSNYDFSMGPAIDSYLGGGHTYSNFGRGGRTARTARETVTTYTTGVYGSAVTATGTMWDVAMAWEPDLIVLNFGINDASIDNLTIYKSNIDAMLAEAHAAGIRVVGWNGPYFWFGPDPNASNEFTADGGASRRASTFPFTDYLAEACRSYGYDVADTRSVWLRECEAGNWDLFGHRDGTYLAGWNTGALYDNVHQWIGGQEVFASTIADVIAYGAYDLDVTLTAPLYPYDLDVTLIAPPATFRPRRQRMAALGGF